MLRVSVVIASLAFCAVAQDPRAALEGLVSDARLAGGRVGVKVVDLENGAVLAAHDADKGFMTASNMKLISSAVALLTLGPHWRFETELRAAGPITDGVLEGDLVLVGSGDPTLGGRHEDGPTAPFVRMARRLREGHGIVEVTGAVLGVDDCQPDEVMGDGWSWGYQGESYAAQPSGLCFAENCVSVVVEPTEAGMPPRVRVVPETGYVAVANTARCVAEPQRRLRIRRLRARNRISVEGELGLEQDPERDSVSVENPTAWAAWALRETLEREGIPVALPAADADDVVREDGGPPARVLATHRSPPLDEILHTLNKVSQNLYAEQLVRAAARHAGEGGGMDAAERHAKSVLRDLGVDTSGMQIADGSGLTRLNLVQPRQLVALLTGMWRGPHRDLFAGTLPVAGIDGTLSSRYEDGPARGRVRAKTGYISRVVALSGYVPRPDPEREPLVFSVLLNDFTCPTADAKDAVDRFVDALARRAGWTGSADGKAPTAR